MNPPNGNYDTNWTAFPHTFHLFPIMALKYSKHLEDSLSVGVIATEWARFGGGGVTAGHDLSSMQIKQKEDSL